jgi:glycosyltransferase involved in cell wall biosynthesis
MQQSLDPLVSIGVPTYNRPGTLERTLNCLVNQTYSNLEIIVSDNCSTDPDVDLVINKFRSDPRVKIFRQSNNKGAIFNINFVLEQATGEFIMRLADDDWLDSNYIEYCLKHLFDNPEYASAYGPAKIYNDQTEFLQEDNPVNMDQDSGSERVKHYLKNTIYNAPFYGLMHRRNYNLLTTTSKLADDWLVVSRIAFTGKFIMIRNTYCYISQGGVSNSFESLVNNLKMPKYIKYFPYFEVGKNVLIDILWGSEVYRSVPFFKRLKFGIECCRIVWKRFNVKSEIKRGSLTLLKKSLSFSISDTKYKIN